MASCSQSTILPTALAPSPHQCQRQQQQQQQDSSDIATQQQISALEPEQCQHTVKMPATYTAFTSRIGLASYEERELARLSKALRDASSHTAVDSRLGTSAKSIAIPSMPNTFGSKDSYSSSTGLFFRVPESTQVCLPKDDHYHESGIDADDDDSSSYSGRGSTSDGCAIADDDEDESDWEDEDEGKNRRAGYDAHGHLVFPRVAKPPTRSLASNLSLLLRQAQSDNTASTGMPRAPFSTGRTTLPNPLRCHPGLVAASLTPESIMSPPMPPPPPPSSPCGSVPLQSATTTAAPSVSGASYTSSSSTPSSSVGSASTSSASSSSGAGSRAPSAYPSRSSSPVMRINQLSALHAPLYHHGSMQSIIDNNGDPLLTMPFNGGLGPRAAPIIHLGPPSPNGPGRREIFSGSGLIESEMTGSLRESIMDENHSRYIFKHYGSRRYVEDDQDGQCDNDSTPGYPPSVYTPSSSSTAGISTSDTPSFRRTQSAPNIPRTSLSSTSKSSLYIADKTPLRRIYYVDDYEAPKSWNWGMDYHSHGW